MAFLPRPAVIFYDLDGTLVDSVPDIADCLDLALQEMGIEPIGEARVATLVGNGVAKLMERALVDRTGVSIPAMQRRLTTLWEGHYAVHCARRSRLYPGAIDCLRAAAAARIPQAIITNKPERHAKMIIQALGIHDYIRLLLGGDTFAESKPHPKPLLHARAVFGGGLPWMVGDSITDIEAARAARIPVVCVTYGYNHGLDIRNAKADRLVDNLRDLPALWGGVRRASGT